MHFRASEMPRVMCCPGSKTIQAAYPDKSGYAAKEGTVAHGIASAVLAGKRDLASYLGQSISNMYIDQEMLHYIQLYINECQNAGSVEQGLSMECEGHTLTGTPDYWMFEMSATAKTLAVKDLKYGYGWVEAYENWQLLTYAVLVMAATRELDGNCDTIELTIIQPRASHPEGPVRSWSFNADLLRGYRNFIIGAMRDAALPKPPIRTGPHCRYCRGLLHCHGAAAAASFAIDYAHEASHGAMAPDTLVLEIEIVDRARKMLDQRMTALEELGLAMCKSGKIIPGWEARSTISPLAWNNDPIAIGDAMGLNLRAPEKPITPTQAVSRKLLTADTIKSLAARGTGGMKLKRVDSARAKRILG